MLRSFNRVLWTPQLTRKTDNIYRLWSGLVWYSDLVRGSLSCCCHSNTKPKWHHLKTNINNKNRYINKCQKPKIISIDPNGSHYNFDLRYDSSDLRFQRYEIISWVNLTFNKIPGRLSLLIISAVAYQYERLKNWKLPLRTVHFRDQFSLEK